MKYIEFCGKGGNIVFAEPLRHNPVARLVRWLTPGARSPDELPLGRPELRLIDRNFAADNYYGELFTVLGVMITRPIYSDPVNPLTRFCDIGRPAARPDGTHGWRLLSICCHSRYQESWGLARLRSILRRLRSLRQSR